MERGAAQGASAERDLAADFLSKRDSSRFWRSTFSGNLARGGTGGAGGRGGNGGDGGDGRLDHIGGTGKGGDGGNAGPGGAGGVSGTSSSGGLENFTNSVNIFESTISANQAQASTGGASGQPGTPGSGGNGVNGAPNGQSGFTALPGLAGDGASGVAGGIYARGNTLTLTNSSVTDNVSSSIGGGIVNPRHADDDGHEHLRQPSRGRRWRYPQHGDGDDFRRELRAERGHRKWRRDLFHQLGHTDRCQSHHQSRSELRRRYL